MRRYLLLVFLLFNGTLLKSQNSFELLIKNAENQHITDCVEDDNSNFYLIGDNENINTLQSCGYVVKINSDGTVLDEENFCIDDSTIFFLSQHIIADSLYIFGIAGEISAAGWEMFIMNILDTNLTQCKSYLRRILPGYYLGGLKHILKNNGHFIVCGNAIPIENTQTQDIYFYEIDINLDSIRCIVDTREYNQMGMDFLENFDKNGYNVFGHGTYPNTVTSYDELIRFDSAFAFQSVDTVAWKLRGQHSALWLDDSTYLVTGQKNLYFPTRKDIGIAKLTQNDELIVANHFGKGIDTVNYPGVSNNVDFVTKDNIYFGGTSNFIVGQWPWQTDDSWILLVNLDSNLNVNWQRYYGGDAFYHLFGLLATQDGGCLTYSVRYDENTQFEEYDVYILKVDSNGLFTSIYDIPSLAYDEILFIPNPAVDHVTAQFPGAVHQKEKTLEIYNNLGILVRRLDVPENQDRMQIDGSFLPNGLYYGVMCSKGQRVAAGKLLIAR